MVRFRPYGQKSLHVFQAGWAKKVQQPGWAGQNGFAMMPVRLRSEATL